VSSDGVTALLLGVGALAALAYVTWPVEWTLPRRPATSDTATQGVPSPVRVAAVRLSAEPTTQPIPMRLPAVREPVSAPVRGRHRRDTAGPGAVTATGLLRAVKATPHATVDQQLQAAR
jgi:hypothetical protein